MVGSTSYDWNCSYSKWLRCISSYISIPSAISARMKNIDMPTTSSGVNSTPPPEVSKYLTRPADEVGPDTDFPLFSFITIFGYAKLRI